MKTLIKNADVVLPTGVVRTNVLVDGPTIAAIDAAVHARADEVVDATGLHLLPGVIDDQVHFREPGLTHKEDLHTASRACAKGGVTTFLEMPNTVPPATTQERLDEKRRLAAEKSLVNYGFYIGATPHNIDDLRTATRTPGIKIFIGSSTGDLLVDDQEALERIFAETTLPISAHCEDEATVRANAERLSAASTDVAVHSQIRDHAPRSIATRRAIDLAARHQHRFHVLHVSTGDETDLLGEYYARRSSGPGSPADHRRSLPASSAAQHRRLRPPRHARADEPVAQDGRRQPPPVAGARRWPHSGHRHRPRAAHARRKAEALPAVALRHAGVENSLALMLNEVHRGRCTLEQVVHWMCDAPARVWDIVGKGRIAVGYDADLVLVDLDRTRTVRNDEQLTKCGWSAWDGVELTGWPVRTWVRGREVFRDGRVDDSVRGEEAMFDHARGGYWATSE